MTTREVKICIRSDVNQIGVVGGAFSALANDSCLSRERLDMIELAVVEVVTNSIEHAYEFAKGFSVELVLSVYEDELAVEVTDYGSPMSEEAIQKYTSGPREIVLTSQAIKDLPEGGWGTSLVANLCDEVEYRRIHTSNVLTLRCFSCHKLKKAV